MAGATVWVVAGPPGAGKSRSPASWPAWRRRIPAVLDKDTLYSGFVAEVLAAYGRDPGEREGAWYDEHAKAHEYGGLTAARARDPRHGCPVLLVAPFTAQIRDPDRWRAWVAELGGEPVRLVWVRVGASTLRRRLEGRPAAGRRQAGGVRRVRRPDAAR